MIVNMEPFFKFLIAGWTIVILILFSWVLQYFYNEYKNKTPKK
jgi:hypothetical protein